MGNINEKFLRGFHQDGEEIAEKMNRIREKYGDEPSSFNAEEALPKLRELKKDIREYTRFRKTLVKNDLKAKESVDIRSVETSGEKLRKVEENVLRDTFNPEKFSELKKLKDELANEQITDRAATRALASMGLDRDLRRVVDDNVLKNINELLPGKTEEPLSETKLMRDFGSKLDERTIREIVGPLVDYRKMDPSDLVRGIEGFRDREISRRVEEVLENRGDDFERELLKLDDSILEKVLGPDKFGEFISLKEDLTKNVSSDEIMEFRDDLRKNVDIDIRETLEQFAEKKAIDGAEELLFREAGIYHNEEERVKDFIRSDEKIIRKMVDFATAERLIEMKHNIEISDIPSLWEVRDSIGKHKEEKELDRVIDRQSGQITESALKLNEDTIKAIFEPEIAQKVIEAKENMMTDRKEEARKILSEINDSLPNKNEISQNINDFKSEKTLEQVRELIDRKFDGEKSDQDVPREDEKREIRNFNRTVLNMDDDTIRKVFSSSTAEKFVEARQRHNEGEADAIEALSSATPRELENMKMDLRSFENREIGEKLKEILEDSDDGFNKRLVKFDESILKEALGSDKFKHFVELKEDYIDTSISWQQASALENLEKGLDNISIRESLEQFAEKKIIDGVKEPISRPLEGNDDGKEAVGDFLSRADEKIIRKVVDYTMANKLIRAKEEDIGVNNLPSLQEIKDSMEKYKENKIIEKSIINMDDDTLRKVFDSDIAEKFIKNKQGLDGIEAGTAKVLNESTSSEIERIEKDLRSFERREIIEKANKIYGKNAAKRLRKLDKDTQEKIIDPDTLKKFNRSTKLNRELMIDSIVDDASDFIKNKRYEVISELISMPLIDQNDERRFKERIIRLDSSTVNEITDEYLLLNKKTVDSFEEIRTEVNEKGITADTINKAVEDLPPARDLKKALEDYANTENIKDIEKIANIEIPTDNHSEKYSSQDKDSAIKSAKKNLLSLNEETINKMFDPDMAEKLIETKRKFDNREIGFDEAAKNISSDDLETYKKDARDFLDRDRVKKSSEILSHGSDTEEFRNSIINLEKNDIKSMMKGDSDIVDKLIEIQQEISDTDITMKDVNKLISTSFSGDLAKNVEQLLIDSKKEMVEQLNSDIGEKIHGMMLEHSEISKSKDNTGGSGDTTADIRDIETKIMKSVTDALEINGATRGKDTSEDSGEAKKVDSTVIINTGDSKVIISAGDAKVILNIGDSTSIIKAGDAQCILNASATTADGDSSKNMSKQDKFKQEQEVRAKKEKKAEKMKKQQEEFDREEKERKKKEIEKKKKK
jgi:hypothetical protein